MSKSLSLFRSQKTSVSLKKLMSEFPALQNVPSEYRQNVVSLHTHICGVRHTFSYKWETYTVVEMWQICCWNDTRLYKEYVVEHTGHITVRSRLKCLRNVALYLNMLRGPPTIFCQQYCTVQFTVQFTLVNQKMCTFLRKLV